MTTSPSRPTGSGTVSPWHTLDVEPPGVTTQGEGGGEEGVAPAAGARARGLPPVETAALTRAVVEARRGLVDDAVAAAQAAGRAGKWSVGRGL